MKAIVLIDIPEDNSLDILSPFNTKVTLDYGDKVLELNGEVHAVPEFKKFYEDACDQSEYEKGHIEGYNTYLDDIMK